MNRTKPIGTAFLVGLLLLVPTVSRAQDLREEIEAIVREDPFCVRGLADFRVIEFRASQRADDIEHRIAAESR